MRVEQRIFRQGAWNEGPALERADLVLAFGSGVGFDPAVLAQVCAAYPGARIVGCTTSGEIAGAAVLDDSLVCTAMAFEHSSVQVATAELVRDSCELTGFQLVESLPRVGLRHVWVVSNGIQVNGDALMRGMRELLPPGVNVTGGLAAGGPRVQKTTVFLDGACSTTSAVAVGFYGERLSIGCGSVGGWVPFGPEREVTRSDGNVLYELDGVSALELYRRYLGRYADKLPASGRLLPLSLPYGIARTVVGIDDAAGSVTFAGEIPQGVRVRLMQASLKRLIEGAEAAGHGSVRTEAVPQLTVMVSCAARRRVLEQRTEEELEAVCSAVGDAPKTGFYAYGELCPTGLGPSELHNQTMTVTTFAEH